MNIQSKNYYMDEDIETLPREKLLEVIDCLFNELESTRRTVRSILELNKLMRRVRERDRDRDAFWDKKQKVHLFTETRR